MSEIPVGVQFDNEDEYEDTVRVACSSNKERAGN